MRPAKRNRAFQFGPRFGGGWPRTVGTRRWVDARRYHTVVSTHSPGTDKYPAPHACSSRRKLSPLFLSSPQAMPPLALQVSRNSDGEGDKDAARTKSESRWVRSARAVVSHVKHHVCPHPRALRTAPALWPSQTHQQWHRSASE